MHVMDKLYGSALKPLLFKCDPEKVHEAFVSVGEAAGKIAPTRALFSGIYNYHGPDIGKTVDGIHWRTPIALSAGFDANGNLTRILPSLGFGGEEIGSVTALPCAGNPKPRLTRLIRNKSLIVNKGLRNHGVDALIRKLSNTPRVNDFVLGISIARTNTQASCADISAGINDYAESFRKLIETNIGDYYTINISCPNSFDGETFTEPALLERLLARLREIPCEKPVYLKMPINLEWNEFSKLLDVADKNGVNGVIIGNLNKKYAELDCPGDAPGKFCGGLSGKPCYTRSNELIYKTREKYGKRFTIIGVGGIFSPEDAMEKFRAGSDLVMLISGMIFEGPGLMQKICERYAAERPAI